ncbi:HypC/HybG/HupF family hydrogenase formation chaperone [Desulfobulbus alkaliphilus]|uniref:HypC/HybG/HupF family hydrogenase formation chaperone n=1 Tax=Desulfobulbus alkaliphilus TaxID=869814 RepID=UPI00196670CA|nr:HypC/HybG/HupF family hydrogenase formation chaperone [Desulfobulbus alkaliphilus]MBM9535575.1 HypC/HybG/HupF family hydrogenase formation chaperone [Desulfobulbus alkaliphilus]
MCLAVPLQVVEVITGSDELLDPGVALVAGDGIRREVRLEMVDRIPAVGEYVIIHAGFAIRTLTEEEAEYNLSLMRRMAEVLEEEGRLPGEPECS